MFDCVDIKENLLLFSYRGILDSKQLVASDCFKRGMICQMAEVDTGAPVSVWRTETRKRVSIRKGLLIFDAIHITSKFPGRVEEVRRVRSRSRC